jgi:hypothetical protein
MDEMVNRLVEDFFSLFAITVIATVADGGVDA